MGRPKHLLQVGGKTLLVHQLTLLGSVCRSVITVAAPENILTTSVPGFRSVGDRIPRCGPLGGIYTGLAITRTEYNLFLGCDLPLMQSRFLRFLCKCALAGEADITVPVLGAGNYEPLCAVYRRRARAAIRASILRGDYKVTHVFRHLACQGISFQEMSGMGFDRRLFTNVNTPADYKLVVSD
jgi:molybdenum cofactor guanylyltransferase